MFKRRSSFKTSRKTLLKKRSRKRSVKSYAKRKYSHKRYKLKRRSHKRSRITVGTHYGRSFDRFDRQHVKFIQQCDSQTLTIGPYSIAAGITAFRKLRLNNINAPGYDWGTSAATRLPISQPPDWQIWGAKYRRYMVTSCKLELSITLDTIHTDSSMLTTFDICVVPVGWRDTGTGTAVPWSTFSQMICQPYATVHRRSVENFNQPVAIRRFIRVQKLEGEPEGASQPGYAGGLSSTTIADPANACHWHIGIHFDKWDATPSTTASFRVAAKMTFYTTLFARALLPDPTIVTLAEEKKAQFIDEQTQLAKEEQENEAMEEEFKGVVVSSTTDPVPPSMPPKIYTIPPSAPVSTPPIHPVPLSRSSRSSLPPQAAR